MTKALFKLFILFITCSTVISCSEQDSPELPDNPGNTNQGIASIDQTQINANGGGFIIRVKADGTWQASSSETWCTLSRTSGNGNGSISGYMKANTGAEKARHNRIHNAWHTLYIIDTAEYTMCGFKLISFKNRQKC